MMNRFWVAFLLLQIIACDDTLDQLQKQNIAPVVTFTYLDNNESLLTDSVKFFRQPLRNDYQQQITITDVEGNLKEVFFKITSGNGKVFSNGINTNRLLQIHNTSSSNEIYSFVYRPEQLGYHEVQIYAVDQLDEYDTLQIRLTVFENLPPIASLSVKPNRVVSKYEYMIDGSESFDGDAKFGGEIVLYQFTINSQVIELEEPKFQYVFGGEQIVNIGLRVQDSDGVWSDRVEGVYVVD